MTSTPPSIRRWPGESSPSTPTSPTPAPNASPPCFWSGDFGAGFASLTPLLSRLRDCSGPCPEQTPVARLPTSDFRLRTHHSPLTTQDLPPTTYYPGRAAGT